MKKRIIFVLLPVLMLCSCNGNEDIPQPTPDEEDIFTRKNLMSNKDYPSSLDSFIPTKFNKDTFKEESCESLGDGVNHKIYTFILSSNNKKVIANAIEVDLTKAKIDSNYKDGGIDTPYNQMLDYENKTNKKVMSILNADFFATGIGTTVNAYVNNSTIIKAAHNDKGIYDYTNLDADIPASKPMLIGISGDEAKISPIISNGSIEETIKSKFKNIIVYKTYDEEKEIDENIGMNLSDFGSSYSFNIITKDLTMSLTKDSKIYKIKLNEDHNAIISGIVEDISTQKLDGNKKFSNTNEYFYIVSKEDLSLEINSKIGYSVTTDDSTYKYANTVIGGRQSLVEKGKIASTVVLENSNGAQTTNIPRSGIGIKNKNTVVIVAIEALRYKASNVVTDSDGYGVNLPEFADFMRYINCYDAMNFDGGGSTQLITKNNNGLGEAKVNVRSSDYGTYNLNDARKVANTIIVATK